MKEMTLANASVGLLLVKALEWSILMYVRRRTVFSGPLRIEIKKNQFMAACMVAAGVSVRVTHLVD